MSRPWKICDDAIQTSIGGETFAEELTSGSKRAAFLGRWWGFLRSTQKKVRGALASKNAQKGLGASWRGKKKRRLQMGETSTKWGSRAGVCLGEGNGVQNPARKGKSLAGEEWEPNATRNRDTLGAWQGEKTGGGVSVGELERSPTPANAIVEKN